jgi:hypothetical protein
MGETLRGTIQKTQPLEGGVFWTSTSTKQKARQVAGFL